MDVLNLSIGGPDYLDLPFVEKVLLPLSVIVLYLSIQIQIHPPIFCNIRITLIS